MVGEGGFCKVRAAIHRVTGAKTAVKLIEKAKLLRPRGTRAAWLARSRAEAAVSKHVHAAHRPRSRRWVFCVMEYADGGSLLDHVRARRRVPEPVATLQHQLCQALACSEATRRGAQGRGGENVLLDARRDVIS